MRQKDGTMYLPDTMIKKHFMTQSSAPAPYEAIDGTSIKCAASESLTINI